MNSYVLSTTLSTERTEVNGTNLGFQPTTSLLTTLLLLVLFQLALSFRGDC